MSKESKMRQNRRKPPLCLCMVVVWCGLCWVSHFPFAFFFVQAQQPSFLQPNNFNPFKDNYNVYDTNTINEATSNYSYKDNVTHFRKLELFGPKLRSNHTLFNPLGFIVVAPSIIQPASIYSVVITVGSVEENPRLANLFDNKTALQGVNFRLSLFRNGADIQGSSMFISPGSSDELKILVPTQLPKAEYKIRIEGNLADSRGGSIFASETPLKFSEKFLSILIHTNRHIYNGEQEIMFRVISLRRNMLPYDDPIDVYILDPRGFIMRRWPSVPSYLGVVDLKYQLPTFSALGHWVIRVVVGSQVQEKKILVERYFSFQHEVYVSLPPFILSTDEEITANIASFYGTEKTGKGNATVRLYVGHWGVNQDARNGNNRLDQQQSQQDRFTPVDRFRLIETQHLFLTGPEDITWPMSAVIETYGSSVDVAIRIEADVTEFFLGETRTGYAESRIIKETIKLRFLETAPKIFKPGMPFRTILTVGYEDLERISEEILETSIIRISPQAQLISGQRIDIDPIVISPSGAGDESNNEISLDGRDFLDETVNILELVMQQKRNQKFMKEGIVEVSFIVPKRTSRLVLKAEFTDSNGVTKAVADMTATSAFSPTGKFVSVALRSGDPVTVGNFVVLQFNANFPLEKFQYLVMSKGLILTFGTEVFTNYWSLPKSFTVVVSPEMVPGFTVFVYVGMRSGEVISDSVFVPVDNILRHRISMIVNGAKDRSKDSVELQLFGDPAAYFGYSAQRSSRHVMQAGNELTLAYVLQTMHSLEPWNRTLHKHVWRDRSGEKADEVKYFPSMSYAIDTYRSFEQSNLILFSDGFITVSPSLQTECPEETCITGGGCYLARQRCDGRFDCADLTDELDCDFQNDDDIVNFRVMRVSRFGDFYDAGNEWEWGHTQIAHSGDKIFMLNTPETTDSWYWTGFAISKKNGFALTESTIEYGTDRAFMMVLSCAPSVRRGEQFGVIAMLYNKTPKEILVLVSVPHSDDYVFVHVGKHGQLEFNENFPRFSPGEHQHLVWMAGDSETEIRIPIKPLIDQGTVSVTITATTQVRSDTETVEIEVLPEGGGVGKHSSLLLDMRSRAVVLKYFNIFVEEVPIVPYEIKRKYVYGSPSAHVTVSGDVIGPLATNLPCSMAKLMGKDGKGTADRIFEMASNVWTLHYLRLTNQLEASTARDVFVEMNKLYAWIMKRFNLPGFFRMWSNSPPSVWLSSWALQTFQHASFQDWENQFFVEQGVFTRVIHWLIQFQNLDGSFSETEWYQQYPINKRMGYMRNMEGGGTNVSLTAHLLITLQLVTPVLDGQVRVEANNAKQSAMRYLERSLAEITNPYHIAITAYALTLADSTEKELAFNLLNSAKTEAAEFVYWSPGEVVTNAITYENNRPFLEAKNNEFWDAIAVESTSYALLVYIIREGRQAAGSQNIPDRSVSWLNTMRLTDGAFISTVDSAVAFQALTEYANRDRVRDVTDMSIKIELSSGGDDEGASSIFIPESLSDAKQVDIPNVWGHVNIEGRGAGYAVVQLDVAFGVDWDEFKDTPPVDAFELKIREFFSDRRNKSDLTIESCFRWILAEESEMSGGAVLEVEIPSGYGLLQTDATDMVEKGELHPYLMDAWSVDGKTSWYFERVAPDWSCFNHTVKRWFPVANLTTHRQATIYEAYSPERFVNTLFNDTSLMLLDICQVCGSYQCPYCPFYNSAPPFNLNLLLISLCLFWTINSLFILHPD